MDTSRSPGGSGAKRRRSPINEYGIPSAHHSQTSLPSFKQLEPFLRSQHMSTDPPSSYPYSAPSHYVPHTPHQQQHDPAASSSQAMPTTSTSQRDSGIYGTVESEADEVDHQSPPKKKRRRQALSCTECKRRKIKCDRSQPCTPCTRRGEEAGCQWHIVEPVEKYATKAEFEDLKARFDQLAALVQRLLPTASTASMPYYSMGVQPSLAGGVISSEAVPGYNPGAASSIVNVYPSLMPPPLHPPSQSYSQILDTSSSSARYTRPEEVTPSSTRHIHPSLGGSTTTSSPILPTVLHSPSLTRPRTLVGDTASSSSGVRSSPLSLASITSPHYPDPQQHQHHHQPHSHVQSQSKNCHAQTFKLGERLRHGSEGPVISQVRHRRRCLSIAPRRQRVLLRLHLRLLVLQPHFIFNKQGPPVGWGVAVVVFLVHLLRGMRIGNG